MKITLEGELKNYVTAKDVIFSEAISSISCSCLIFSFSIVANNSGSDTLRLSVKSCFIRGSVVRYVQLPADEVDTQLLQDAARKEVTQNKQ